MPNWCSTWLRVIGPYAEVQAFHSKVNTPDGIIRTHVPCPEELQDTPERWVINDKEEQAKQEEREQANLAKYGYRTWYDWNIANWGTKWADCHTQVSPPEMTGYRNNWEMNATFDTAWSTADEAWTQISRMYPNTAFYMGHDEEGGHYAGVQVFHNGFMLVESMFSPGDYGEDLDWDDPESVDRYEEWKDQENERVAIPADTMMQGRWIPPPKDSAPPDESLSSEETPAKKGHFWS